MFGRGRAIGVAPPQVQQLGKHSERSPENRNYFGLLGHESDLGL